MSSATSTHIAVVATRIAQFAALSRDDQLRAAALALKRDFGVTNASLKLAAKTINDGGERVLIAYTTSPTGFDAIDLSWVERVADGAILWRVGNGQEEGLLFSNQGIAHIDAWSNGKPAPTALVALIASRNKTQQGQRVLVDDDINSVDEKTLALWRASLGVEFERETSKTVAAPTTLVNVPTATATRAVAGIDRALFAAALASLLCFAFALWRYASLPATTTVNNTATTNAGELWARATLAAPELQEFTKTANYGGGAWVIASPALPMDALPRIEATLKANELSTQIVREPELRIRVQR
ncbi:MAG: hypothetical protein ACRCWJ_19725 [Casimicrobium sp.]